MTIEKEKMIKVAAKFSPDRTGITIVVSGGKYRLTVVDIAEALYHLMHSIEKNYANRKNEQTKKAR